VGCEDVLDEELEQRPQPRGDLLTRHAGAEPPLVDLEALAEVAERRRVGRQVRDGAARAVCDPTVRYVRSFGGRDAM
jgi:hypothetical protein